MFRSLNAAVQHFKYEKKVDCYKPTMSVTDLYSFDGCMDMVIFLPLYIKLFLLLTLFSFLVGYLIFCVLQFFTLLVGVYINNLNMLQPLWLATRLKIDGTKDQCDEEGQTSCKYFQYLLSAPIELLTTNLFI